MTAELARGQNHPLPQTRLEIRVAAGAPVIAAATLSDEHDAVPGPEHVAHPGRPRMPGLEVPRQAAADHRIAVDLGAMAADVHRVSIVLALPAVPDGPAGFGAVAAPAVTVTGTDGAGIARFTLEALATESAVIAVELYRRGAAWKVRAVGQGYAGGLVALFTDQRLTGAAELAAAVDAAVAQGLARSVDLPPARGEDPTRVRAGAAGHPEPDASAASAPGSVPPGPFVPEAPGPTGNVGGSSGSSGSSGSGVDYTHPRRRPSTPPPPATPPSATPPSATPPSPSVSAPSDPRAAGASGGTPPGPLPPAGQPGAPVAGDANGWSMEERLYNQAWGIFEDFARTVASYRSAVEFAESRRDKEIEDVISDPRNRIGSQGDAARAQAQERHRALVEQARQALDRDLAVLTAEAEVVEPALPAAFARWDNPVWHAYSAPEGKPLALRLGDLHLPESPLRIPMLMSLPLRRGLWIDSGARHALTAPDELRRLALDSAVAVTARLLAAHPPGDFSVHVIDAAGSAYAALEPLLRNGVLAGPPAYGAAGVSETLARLTQRVDLVQMALRSGATDALPPELDTAEQLLVVNDFPHGFDERAVTQLRYLADEGPSVGVHLLMVADREEASAYGPLLDPLWRTLMRITPVPDDHLADPWVGHAWTYEPSLVPAGSGILQQVLAQVAAARGAGGR